jgi:hypothetical protein
MEVSNDIIEFKRKRKIKNYLRKTLIIIFVICLTLGLYFTTKYLDEQSRAKFKIDSGEIGQLNTEFPINLSGDEIKSISRMGTTISVLTDKKVHTYSEKGKELFNKPHNLLNPVLVKSAKKNLVYDRNGNNYIVFDKDKVEYSTKIDFPIILAQLSEEGFVAIATKDSRYAGNLSIYDKNNKEIFKWNTSEMQIASIDFINGSKGCVVATVGAKNGVIITEVKQLNFTSEKEIASTIIPECLALSLSIKSGGNISVVCDNKVVALNSKLEVIREYVFENDIYLFTNEPQRNTILLLKDDTVNGYRLELFDINGVKISSHNISEAIRFLKSDGSRVLVVLENSILDFDMSLKLINTLQSGIDTKKIEIIGLSGYIVGTNNIQKIEVD